MVWAAQADGDIATTNTVNIPKGSQNAAWAYGFIDVILLPELQAQLVESGTAGLPNATVELSPEAAAKWTTGAERIAGLARVVTPG